jgi:hypothetical protein
MYFSDILLPVSNWKQAASVGCVLFEQLSMKLYHCSKYYLNLGTVTRFNKVSRVTLHLRKEPHAFSGQKAAGWFPHLAWRIGTHGLFRLLTMWSAIICYRNLCAFRCIHSLHTAVNIVIAVPRLARNTLISNLIPEAMSNVFRTFHLIILFI